ncbi:MAG: M15 family metallopeptidase [Myxococcota bacterium]|jgi:peptidoglycan L-alanyl-D-glutamate endopeptidase CwlK|nr:M15 family metallopeptidase [Myxococcota bacterium]
MSNTAINTQTNAGAQNAVDGPNAQNDQDRPGAGAEVLDPAAAGAAVNWYTTNAAKYPQAVIDRIRTKLGNVAASGAVDTAFVQSVASYQQTNKLSVDGKAGGGTLNHMFGEDIRVQSGGAGASGGAEGDPRGKLAALHPQMQARARMLLANAKKKGLSVWVVDGMRTIAEQDALYAQGRTKPGKKVTNVRGGGSYHNYGVAIDVVFSGSSPWGEQHDWAALGQAGVEAGLEWGGNWKGFVDRPHFQIAGLSTAILKQWHANGGMANVWAKVGSGGVKEEEPEQEQPAAAQNQEQGAAAGETEAPAQQPEQQQQPPQQAAAQQTASFDVARAVSYNRNRGYSREQWKQIQRVVGTDDDGRPGENTARAVFTWQQSKGLEPDGRVGPQTLGAINREGGNAQAPAPVGNTPAPPTSNPQTPADTPAPATGAATKSGSHIPGWATQQGYVNSTNFGDLDATWGPKAETFVTGLRGSGASVNVTAGLRHPKRARIMRTAWDLAGGAVNVATANADSAAAGVAVDWDHGNAAASRTKAAQTKSAFGLVARPSLTSNHIAGKAIDMSIQNVPANLTVGGRAFQARARSGGTLDESKVKHIGDAFGVIWYGPGDYVHWSHNGR